jgi:hypothetical protein
MGRARRTMTAAVATANFNAVLGTRRGEEGTSCLTFTFETALDELRKSVVEEYIYSRLTTARPLCHWDGCELHVECKRTSPREHGIVRLHLQRIAGVTASGPVITSH